MKYEYDVDSKLYDNEIKNFIKSNSTFKKSKQKIILLTLIITAIVTIIFFIKSVIKNIYYIDFMYILLVHIIIYISVAILIFVYVNFYFNFKQKKRLLKYWKKGYVYTLEMEDEKIYFSGFIQKRLDLSNFILDEVKDLDNIFIILAINKEKKLCYMIIIPKDIFKSKEELSKFKNIIENILEKQKIN